LNTQGNFHSSSLSPGEAIIHYGYISDFPIDRLSGVLDASEKARVDKFHQAADRLQYITCRAILKLLLSQYTGLGAADIHLQYTPGGKPMMPGMNAIHFNVSHCRSIMVWGFSCGNSIGVDVENLEVPISADAVATVCSETEIIRLQRVPSDLQNECLINCWTRKEALLKAVGSLSIPIRLFEVSMENEKAKILTTPGPEREKDQWYLHSLDLPGNYRGAVAIKGIVSHLNISRLDSSWVCNWYGHHARQKLSHSLQFTS
jgi:4'-phosphopantetheinyl transferase